jgi:hypothetical protein
MFLLETYQIFASLGFNLKLSRGFKPVLICWIISKNNNVFHSPLKFLNRNDGIVSFSFGNKWSR